MGSFHDDRGSRGGKMRVFWRNRSIAYCLVLAIATVMLTFDYAGASIRYRLGAGDEINLTTVTKIN